MNSNWEKLAEEIGKAENFVIFPHVNLDGDSIGSASGLCLGLRKMGKNAVILTSDDIPHYLSPLTDHSLFVRECPYEDYIAIAVDCSEDSRLDERLSYFRKSETTLCIDHHLTDGSFADYCVIDADAAAASVLVYKFLKFLGVEFDKEIAETLYLGISTDTGSFKYINANEEAFYAASELFRYGVENVKICNQVYSTYPLPQILFEGRAVSNCEVFADGRAVISYLTKEEMDELGGTYSMSDTCIDRLRCIEGVEVACFVKEMENGGFKASLRSKNWLNVNTIAVEFGGGGHLMASGCSFDGTLEETLTALKKRITEAFN